MKLENKLDKLNLNLFFEKMKSINEFHDDTNSDKLLLLYENIKKEILIFKSDNQKNGFYFDIKLNEKQRKIKIFLTLLKNSDINKHNADINFIIICEENYPEKEPKVFCASNVI